MVQSGWPGFYTDPLAAVALYGRAGRRRNSLYSIRMACLDNNLLRLLPNALRARDSHLYLEGGKRLTDLWRWGGRAVLGHKPPKVLVELKNAAERGLFTPLPHPLERRFIKALSAFFPGRTFRLYSSESTLRQALTEAGLLSTISGPLHDPAFPCCGSEPAKVSLWRPFLDEKVIDTALVPVLPWPQGPAVLVLAKNMETSFPAGELIPPVLLAPAARALHNLAAALKVFDPKLGKYPRVRKALGGLDSGESLWYRRGIYLTVEPGMDREKYESLFRRFLEAGFLVPPSPSEPAMLPLAMSAGEEAKLAALLNTALLK